MSVIITRVQDYQEKRYLQPQVAVWRTNGYSIVKIKPPVQILPVHAKGEHLVSFDDKQRLEDIDTDKLTMLEEFYKLCATSNEPRELGLTYTMVPRYYAWSNKSWKRRTKTVTRHEVPMLGQMITVTPQSGSRWFVYLLLLHKVAPTSDEDLRTGAVSSFIIFSALFFSERCPASDGTRSGNGDGTVRRQQGGREHDGRGRAGEEAVPTEAHVRHALCASATVRRRRGAVAAI